MGRPINIRTEILRFLMKLCENTEGNDSFRLDKAF